MTHPMSRAQRMEAFLREACQMYSDLEEWYEAHPEASFDEIEEEARQRRRALMGHALEILINGRDTGFRFNCRGAVYVVPRWILRGTKTGPFTV